MKRKLDFITNSSSTSFIISDHNDTRTVAKKMLDIIFDEWKSLDYNDEEFIKKMYNRVKKLSKNENIMIPFSCNYETFIFKTEAGNIFVDTCNNHSWYRKLNFDPQSVLSDQEFEKFDKHIQFVNIENESVHTRDKHLDIIFEELSNRIKGETK
jgi:hypothetical protein